MKTKPKVIFFLLPITFIICNCSHQSTETSYPWELKPITHTSLIGSESCRPPCWEGITPQETTYEEAISIIADLPNTHPDGEFKSGFANNQRFISWYGGIDENSRQTEYVGIYFNENIVQHMRLDFDDVDLGSIVALLGDPHGFDFFYDHPGGFGVICYYPSIGITVTASKYVGPSEKEWIITKDMEVFKIHFLSPDDPKTFPAKLHEFESVGVIKNHYAYEYFLWEGFGIDVLGNE